MCILIDAKSHKSIPKLCNDCTNSPTDICILILGPGYRYGKETTCIFLPNLQKYLVPIRKNKCYSRFVLYKRKKMKHTYHIHGMTCNGCRAHVERTLSQVEGVQKASVDLEKSEAIIEMEKHVPIETFQQALQSDGGRYSIHAPGHHHHRDHHSKDSHPQSHLDHAAVASPVKKGKGKGVFYCPMHCEGEKTYDGPGDCPVCGMDLVEE